MLRTSVLVLCLVPGITFAQTAPERDRQFRVRNGQLVRVTQLDGSRIEGALASITGEELTLRGAQPVTIRRDAVRVLEVRDSPKEGALVGLAVGSVAGLFGGHVCLEDNACIWTPALVAAGFGAAIGALIDRATPWKTTYRGRPRMSVSPLVARRGGGLIVQWRFDGR